MISGHGTIETAVEATRLGAFDFIEKPLDRDRVLLTVRNAREFERLAAENQAPPRVGSPTAPSAWSAPVPGDGDSEGRSARSLRPQARVLITGRERDGQGARRPAPPRHAARASRQAFVEVNCAAIPQELLESELFGHEKGSFTGATEQRKRQVRAGRRRHALPRRGRRHDARGPGQGPAGARGAARSQRVGGRETDPRRRPASSRPRTRTSRRRSRRARSARTSSTGSTSSPSACRPLRERRDGRAAARDPLPDRVRRRAGPHGPEAVQRSPRPAPAPAVARQRPPAPQPHGAVGDPRWTAARSGPHDLERLARPAVGVGRRHGRSSGPARPSRSSRRPRRSSSCSSGWPRTTGT